VDYRASFKTPQLRAMSALGRVPHLQGCPIAAIRASGFGQYRASEQRSKTGRTQALERRRLTSRTAEAIALTLSHAATELSGLRAAIVIGES
jgi:hypothetical protein